MRDQENWDKFWEDCPDDGEAPEVGVSETAGCSTHDVAIDALRGSLQNCVNYLERAKRKSNNGGYDDAIEQANKTLYETLVR